MDTEMIGALEEAMGEIWDIARHFDLDPFPTHFELVPATIMYEFGAYGLPGRFSHWSFGKGYYRMKTQYDYGLSKIYEMVINSNPSFAFLMEANTVLQNKLVIAHVLGHTDFFKHNAYFERTNRSMVDTTSLHAERIRKYEFLYGTHAVELFLDAALSIQEHIDPHLRFRRHAEAPSAQEPRRAPSSGFEDLWELGEDAAAERERAAREQEQAGLTPQRVPAEPEKDIMRFLIEHAPDLADWQRDVLDIVRQEMLYFVPQMQTKIMNEGWACATGDSLLLTERGFMRFDQVHAAGDNMRVAAGGAGQLYRITDHHCERMVPTIRIRTRRGLTIEGAHRHRVQLADGTWAPLCDLKIGDRVALDVGAGIWPAAEQPCGFLQAVPSTTLGTVAAEAGSVWTVMRHMRGRRTVNGTTIARVLETTGYQQGMTGKVLPTRSALQVPQTLGPDLAWLLGYFVGDGNTTKSGICFTTGDADLRDKLLALIPATLGLTPTSVCDGTETGGRWRINIHSRDLLDWLAGLGLDLQAQAPAKAIPPVILRSPKPVMSAFLRGYFDADAYAGSEGIRLVSSSETLIRAVQIVLLNYGILSTQRPKRDGCMHLEVTGKSAARFLAEIGFALPRKQAALRRYVEGHAQFKREDLTDRIVAIEPGWADVYDITVDTKHSYVANGFINHNSYWHARILRELELTDDEVMEFANLNAGVVAPHRRSINPYHLGLKIFEDIERRWDQPTKDQQARGAQPGRGRAKIFEVRELDNDLSFLRNYLTKELVDELDLYLYERHGNEWVIVEKDWEKVRDGLLNEMTNFGNPTIVVEDGDYRRSRELYLVHRHEGRDLDTVYAEKTLQYMYQLWGRPVHLETIVEGDRILLSYDGTKNTRTEL
jgi:stage V sporulation protein R